MKLELFRQAVADSRDGITISEVRGGENPLVYVNPAFERMTGYSFEEIVNQDCRYLQKTDRMQPALADIRDAVEHGKQCLVTLRNYRKDGSMFWNELSLSPIRDDSGVVTNFIGIQKDVTARVVAEEELLLKSQSLEEEAGRMAHMALTDALTGIYNRRFFDTQLDIQWKMARRQGSSLSLLLIDVDHFKAYNDTYGHLAGDATLTAVAKSLDLYLTRSSDFVARYGGEEFAVLSASTSQDQSRQFAEALCQRIRDLRIPHSASSSGFLTVSIGYAVHCFERHQTVSELIAKADAALYSAKAAGRGRCHGYLS